MSLTVTDFGNQSSKALSYLELTTLLQPLCSVMRTLQISVLCWGQLKEKTKATSVSHCGKMPSSFVLKVLQCPPPPWWGQWRLRSSGGQRWLWIVTGHGRWLRVSRTAQMSDGIRKVSLGIVTGCWLKCAHTIDSALITYFCCYMRFRGAEWWN